MPINITITEEYDPQEYIYLQVYDDNGEPLDVYENKVTWNESRINESDVMYIRVDSPRIKAILGEIK